MDQNIISEYLTHTRNNNGTMCSWFNRAIINNTAGNVWFILRENSIELKVNLSFGLSSKKNPILRGYEKQFFKEVTKNNI